MTADCVATTFVLLEQKAAKPAAPAPPPVNKQLKNPRLTRIVVLAVLAAVAGHCRGAARRRPLCAGSPAAARSSRAGDSAGRRRAAEPYSYNPDGRRDPFVSLVSRGMQPESTGRRAEGSAGSRPQK